MSILDQLKQQGGLIQLEGDKEYSGQIVITEDSEIIGNGSTIWASEGPVIKVTSGVTLKLRNLRIELVTPPDGKFCSGGETRHNLALEIDNDATIQAEDTYIKGGVKDPSGEPWEIPAILSLGVMKPRHAHTYLLSILLPENSKMTCAQNIFHLKKLSEKDGVSTYQISIPSIIPNEVIRGGLHIQHPLGITQIIYLHGNGGADESVGHEAVDMVLFKPQTSRPSDSSTPSSPKLITPIVPQKSVTLEVRRKDTSISSIPRLGSSPQNEQPQLNIPSPPVSSSLPQYNKAKPSTVQVITPVNAQMPGPKKQSTETSQSSNPSKITSKAQNNQDSKSGNSNRNIVGGFFGKN